MHTARERRHQVLGRLGGLVNAEAFGIAKEEDDPVLVVARIDAIFGSSVAARTRRRPRRWDARRALLDQLSTNTFSVGIESEGAIDLEQHRQELGPIFGGCLRCEFEVPARDLPPLGAISHSGG